MDRQTILVAEDEHIIGCDLCETVAEAGYDVDGPFEDVSTAMLAYQKRKPDLAILDIRLADGISFSLAEKMIAENVPVIFHSGQYSSAEVNARCPGTTAVAKPSPPAEIIARVQDALGG